MLPFENATPEQCTALRELLTRAGYTEEGICRRMELSTIYDFEPIRQGRKARIDVADELDVLVRLLLDGASVKREIVEGLLGAAGSELLLSFGLIRPHPEHPEAYAATVLLYPTRSLFLVSDLTETAPGIAAPPELERSDIVYSAITGNTGRFLSMLPSTPCEDFLELCAGTGVAALIASQYARRAWAVDITERATRFADFNARLNAIGNVDALQGDLYEPVADLTFDRIAAHPPYIPGGDLNLIYAHAGEDGEAVLRGVLEGLPRHLRPGGRFYATFRASDRVDAPLEQRIRGLLGDASAEFDVVLVSYYAFHPTEYYARLAASGRVSWALVEERHEMYRRLRAERLVYGSVVLQRHAVARAPFTLRVDGDERVTAADVDRLVGWHTTVAERDVVPLVLDSRPRLSTHARLQMTHEAEDGAWRPRECRLTSDRPFPRTVQVSPSAALFLAACDGSHTLREQLDLLRREGRMDDEVTDEAFAGFVRDLVGEGIVELDVQGPAPASPAVETAVAAAVRSAR